MASSEATPPPTADSESSAAGKTPTPTPSAAKTPEPAAKTPEPAAKTLEPASKSPAPKTPEPAAKTPEPAARAKENEDPKKEEGAAGAEAKKDVAPSEDGSRPSTPKGPTLRELFRAYSKFGNTNSDGKVLTLSQSDKWMKQAKVIDGKTISTTDTAITFKKFKQMKIGFADYEKYLDELAKYKKQDVSAIKEKMRNCGTPGTRGTTSVVKNSAVDRLTDTKGYTGSHKQRFDKEGKGKGVAGRKEVPDKSGYVAGYKNKNSYDKTH